MRDWRFLLLVLTLILAITSIIISTMPTPPKRLTVDPATYKPLLSLIGRAESSGNYNAYFGNGGNKRIKFTEMSIAEVQKWQADYVRQGSPSSAVGKYQFLDSTLAGLVDRLNIDPNEKFTPAMQDRLAIALIERRGAEAYVNDELTQKRFAHNLSKEWAGFPRVIGKNPTRSYYAGDGLNKSRVSVDAVLKAIEPISPQK
jgi:conjugal transfer mating pair stabilization protein TraG